jgi:hypothetical protein
MSSVSARYESSISTACIIYQHGMYPLSARYVSSMSTVCLL